MLLIGLAAGTVSELFTDVYGPVSITGVELDPAILEVGERYFDMTQPNLTAMAADGRTWLAGQAEDTRFDLIAVDAYRPPYIPFHLATREFFQLAYDHLSEDGVLAINVGRTASNFSLVDALATTVAQVFPSVYVIDEPGPPDAIGNSLLVATVQPTSPENLQANIDASGGRDTGRVPRLCRGGERLRATGVTAGRRAGAHRRPRAGGVARPPHYLRLLDGRLSSTGNRRQSCARAEYKRTTTCRVAGGPFAKIQLSGFTCQLGALGAGR